MYVECPHANMKKSLFLVAYSLFLCRFHFDSKAVAATTAVGNGMKIDKRKASSTTEQFFMLRGDIYWLEWVRAREKRD